MWVCYDEWIFQISISNQLCVIIKRYISNRVDKNTNITNIILVIPISASEVMPYDVIYGTFNCDSSHL